MRISVIVPVYNVVDYLDRCLESIVDQSFVDFEIILVDDGSSDGSGEKCRKWKARDNRILLIEQSNQGVSKARNRGIEEAHGDYLVFVDSDDYLDKNFLMVMNDCSSRHPKADIVLCGYRYNDKGEISNYSFFKGNQSFTEKDKVYLISRSIGVYEEKIDRKTHLGVPWAKMYKKSFILENNIFFDENMPRMQDLIFNIKCFKKVQFAEYIDEPLYTYVKRIQSTANGYAENYEKQANQIIEKLCDELDEYRNDYVQETLKYKAVLLLIENIRLKYSNKRSTLNILDKCRSIRMICSREPYASAIDTSYKYIHNSFSRNLFLFFLKQKMILLAYWLVVVKYKGE